MTVVQNWATLSEKPRPGTGSSPKTAGSQSVNMLMNKENQRVEAEERYPNQAMTRNISYEETESALIVMTCGKAVGADDIPTEAWKCIGNFGIQILCKLLNCIIFNIVKECPIKEEEEEYGTYATGLATKYIDTNLQGKM